MELFALQNIAQGITSLAELEEKNPILGQDLKKFVDTVNKCCRAAYERFGTALDDVLTLSTSANDSRREEVLTKLRDASDSKWFRDVAKICDQLAAIAQTYDVNITMHIEKPDVDAKSRHSLQMLLMILHRHEGDLKRDIRHTVDRLKVEITESRISDAQKLALAVKSEISSNLTKINGVSTKILGSSSTGAQESLSTEQVAEEALRRPEMMLVLNAAFLLILLVVGATVLQFVSFYAFPLLTGFVLTAVVVVNAIYLRSIDKLQEESFLALLRLALLKFFAPMTRTKAPAKDEHPSDP